MVLVNIPVREDDNIDPAPVSPVHLQKQPVNGLFQRGVLIIGNGNHLHLKTRLLHIFDFQQIGAGENGIVHL